MLNGRRFWVLVCHAFVLHRLRKKSIKLNDLLVKNFWYKNVKNLFSSHQFLQINSKFDVWIIFFCLICDKELSSDLLLISSRFTWRKRGRNKKGKIRPISQRYESLSLEINNRSLLSNVAVTMSHSRCFRRIFSRLKYSSHERNIFYCRNDRTWSII